MISRLFSSILELVSGKRARESSEASSNTGSSVLPATCPPAAPSLETAVVAEYQAGEVDPLSPDTPQDFGYKVNWFAIKTDDLQAVASALATEPGMPANWASGMAAIDRHSKEDDGRPWVFLSPVVSGWVFIIGSALPYPVMHTPDRHRGIGQKFDALLARLTSHFEEVQFFGSYRVVDFVAWARARRGQPLRIFSYGDGQVFANVGTQTQEEASLGFPDISGLALPAATDHLFSAEGMLPDEDDVLRVAALWSLNPIELSVLHSEPTLGLVLRLPMELAQ